MKKIRTILWTTLTTFVLSASIVSAHSAVSPAQTFTQKNETFSVSVPNEKPLSTIGVKLLVPETLDRVTPFVKPGWRIKITKDEAGKVTQIEWIGGAIPEGQRDAFQFTGRTAATSTQLIWKVYQTYQDGEVVGWDRDPNAKKEGEERVANPWSVTDVVTEASSTPATTSSNTDMSLIISLGALLVAIAGMFISLRK